VDVVVYGYFGKGNLGDEALAEVWRGALAESGRVKLSAPLQIPRGDVVIFTGEPLQDRTSRRSLLFYSLAIQAAARRGRVVLGAVGVDVRSFVGRRLLLRILRRVDYISVRDPHSRKLLGSLGIGAREFRDAALLLPPCETHRRRGVLLNLVPALPPGTRAEALRFARGIARRLGVEPKGFVMARGEDEQALVGLELIAPRTVDEAREVIGGATLVVGARLHFLEFALLCGTPFVAVPYAPKVSAFLALVERDLPHEISRIPGASVRDTLEKILSPHYGAALKAARERLQAEASEGVEDVVRFLRAMA
jgi:polysaccharide pyruvyl transferase WcaK-like protein